MTARVWFLSVGVAGADVKTLREARDAWNAYRDSHGLGASDLRGQHAAGVLLPSGETVALLSYNGRVWLTRTGKEAPEAQLDEPLWVVRVGTPITVPFSGTTGQALPLDSERGATPVWDKIGNAARGRPSIAERAGLPREKSARLTIRIPVSCLPALGQTREAQTKMAQAAVLMECIRVLRREKEDKEAIAEQECPECGDGCDEECEECHGEGKEARVARRRPRRRASDRKHGAS